MNNNSPEFENQLQLPDDNVSLARCLDKLMRYPLSNDRFWKTELGRRLAHYQNLVIGEFIKVFVDKSFEKSRMPKHWEKQIKAHIRLESQILGWAWKLIRLCPDPKPLSRKDIELCELIMEREIILFQFYEGVSTATKKIQDQQGINRKLQNFENPFSGKATHEFIKRCITEANRNPDTANEYRAFVKLRMDLTTSIRTSGCKVFDIDGRCLENRGRKSRSTPK